MKKVLKISAIVVGVLLILLVLVPLVFKNKIQEIIREQVNKSVLANVEWDGFGLNFFRGFPDLSVNLKGGSVVGLDPFEGDTLAGFDRFELRVKPFSAVKGDLVVESILLLKPVVNGLVLEDGRANWDIFPVSETAEEEEEGRPIGKGLELKRLNISEGRIFYNDKALDMSGSLEDFSLNLTGDFSLEQTDLVLEIGSKPVNVRYGAINYLKNGELDLTLEAAADLIHSLYTLKESRILLNGLELGIDGSVSLPEHADMVVDLNFQNRETSFKTLLSLIPAIYLQDFESVQTEGLLKLSGTLKGILNDSINPDAVLNLEVSDGYFAYPDLPGAVSNIRIGLEANYNGTDQDLTTLDLHAFHFEMAGNPMDVNLHLATPMSDMRVQGMAKGLIDFASLADVVPLEELKLSGKLETDIIINTLMSCIENEDYENVDVRGNLVISDLLFHTPALPDSLHLKQLAMRFTPEFMYLDGMDAVIGPSDLHLEGHLTNFIPYIFKGETVSGTLNVASDLLDLNPFVPEKDTAAFSESDSLGVSVHDTAETEQALRIPQNIDFGMRLEMKKILYQQIMVENLNGKIHVNEGIAILEGLGLDILDGKVSTEGKVDTRKELTYVTAGLDIRGVDIPRSYETLVTVEKLAPMAKYCKGRFNTDMTYESFLDNSFEPVYESINAQGNLSTEDLQVYNLKSFIRLSEVLKNEKLKNIVPDDVSLAFRIEDGRVMVEPFDVRFENSRMNVSGSHGIDRTMDYYLDMEIARSDLGTGAGELLSRIGALASAAGLQIPESDYVKVMAHIGGTFEDPVVTTDLSGNVRSKGAEVEEQFRERVEQEIGEKEEEIRDQAGEEAERIIREAEAEAARIIEQAEKAGAEIVAEAERQGDKLIREAGSNPIKKAAAERAARELKKQAEEKSAALILEAEKRADAVIAGAKEEASKIRN